MGGERGIAPGAITVATGVMRQRQRRATQSARCFDVASKAIAKFQRGDHVFGLTKGQFSMIDLASAILEKTGPACLDVWTWCIADYEVEAVSAFMQDRRVTRLRMLMDYSAANRDLPLIAELQARFGDDCMRITKTHAKILAISNEAGWRVVARGSMNLNANPRFEQFDVSDDSDVFGVVSGVMDEIWSKAPPLPAPRISHQTAAAAFDQAEDGITAAWVVGLRPDWF